MALYRSKTGAVAEATRFLLGGPPQAGVKTDSGGKFVEAQRDGYIDKQSLSDGDFVVADPDPSRGFHRVPAHLFVMNWTLVLPQ